MPLDEYIHIIFTYFFIVKNIYFKSWNIYILFMNYCLFKIYTNIFPLILPFQITKNKIKSYLHHKHIHYNPITLRHVIIPFLNNFHASKRYSSLPHHTLYITSSPLPLSQSSKSFKIHNNGAHRNSDHLDRDLIFNRYILRPFSHMRI